MGGILLVVCMAVSVLVGGASCEVLLNSTLRNGSQVHHGDTVICSCITTGSVALAWRSNEYIGANGEQLSLSLLGSTSSLNSYAIATLDETYVENGQRILESTLIIHVQGNIPSASVTCYSLGTDESNTISFHLAENPFVSCGNPSVCPGDTRTFTCETRDSNTLAWESEQYIGTGGFRLSFFSLVSQTEVVKQSAINPNVTARLMVNEERNGVRVLKSELTVIVSPHILDDIHHLITCVNVGLDTQNNYSLNLAQDGACDSAVFSETEAMLQSTVYTREVYDKSEDRGGEGDGDIILIIILCAALSSLIVATIAVVLVIIIKKFKGKLPIEMNMNEIPQDFVFTSDSPPPIPPKMMDLNIEGD